MQNRIHVTRAVYSWDETNAFVFSIVDQVRHLTFCQMVAVWILVVGISSVFERTFDIIACIGFAIGFDRHVVQHKTHAIISN